jgi:hypothetical protein
MKVTKSSMFTGKTRELELPCTPEQFKNWKNGTLIQDAFPALSIDQREFLITGAWEDEWDTYIREPEEAFEEELSSGE